MSPLSPSVYDLLSFLLCLKDQLKLPQAIMNYFSSIKIWVTSGAGDLSAFTVSEIKTMKQALFKTSNHSPSRAPGLTLADFKGIIDFLSELVPSPLVITVSLIIAYFTLARESNLVLTNPLIADCLYVLKVRDVNVTSEALFITIRMTKTRFSSAPPVVFRFPALPSSSCCPVQHIRAHPLPRVTHLHVAIWLSTNRSNTVKSS